MWGEGKERLLRGTLKISLRNGQLEDRTGSSGVIIAERSPVRRDDLVGDGQSQARPLLLAGDKRLRGDVLQMFGEALSFCPG